MPLARRGLAGRHTYVLIVEGRRTGRRYETPVRLLENGERWLVAPYGEVAWVRNARASGEVTLARAGKLERFSIEQADAGQSAPVLRRYVKQVPVVRPFFDVGPRSDQADFAREASRHPVFRLVPARDQHRLSS